MTNRERQITRSLLDFLHNLDQGQATELEIHAALRRDTTITPPVSAAECAAAVANCDSRKWITGVPARFIGKMKWNLNDAGAAARLELAE